MKKLEWIVLFAAAISMLVNGAVSSANQGKVEIFEEDRTPWSSLTELNIFDKENGDMRLGPGRVGEYTFFVRNTRNEDIIFTLGLMESSEFPIGYSIQNENGEWLLGKEGEKVFISTGSAEIQEKVNANSEVQLTLYWEWSFEEGEDVRDTQIGNMVALYKVSFHFQAKELETDRIVSRDTILRRGDGRPKTGDVPRDISFIIFAMIIAIFVIIILRKNGQCREEDTGDATEGAMSVTEDIVNATKDTTEDGASAMNDIIEEVASTTNAAEDTTEKNTNHDMNNVAEEI